MAWDPEWDELFVQSCTLTAPGAVNAYGRKAVGATPISRACYIEFKVRQVRNVKSDLVTSSIAVYLSGKLGVTGVTPEWKVTLPDGTDRPIISVSRYTDESGGDGLYEILYLS